MNWLRECFMLQCKAFLAMDGFLCITAEITQGKAANFAFVKRRNNAQFTVFKQGKALVLTKPE